MRTRPKSTKKAVVEFDYNDPESYCYSLVEARTRATIACGFKSIKAAQDYGAMKGFKVVLP